MIIPRKMKIGNNAKLNKLENNYDKNNKNLLRQKRKKISFIDG